MNVSNLFINADRTLRFVPLLSTVASGVDLAMQGLMKLNLLSYDKTNHPYRNYIHEKSWVENACGLVPVVGNLAIILFFTDDEEPAPPPIPPASVPVVPIPPAPVRDYYAILGIAPPDYSGRRLRPLSQAGASLAINHSLQMRKNLQKIDLNSPVKTAKILSDIIKTFLSDLDRNNAGFYQFKEETRPTYTAFETVWSALKQHVSTLPNDKKMSYRNALQLCIMLGELLESALIIPTAFEVEDFDRLDRFTPSKKEIEKENEAERYSGDILDPTTTSPSTSDERKAAVREAALRRANEK